MINLDSNHHGIDPHRWRDFIGFWVLGFCTYFGYIVMLSAAHDILTEYNTNTTKIQVEKNNRNCNEESSGLILLADILPSMAAKLLSPFMPLWIDFRLGFIIIQQFVGFLLVSLATSKWQAYLGIIFVSFSSGLSEASLLGYTTYFIHNVLSTWASGTGTACLIAAGYYAIFCLVLEPWIVILTCLWVPLLQSITFWILIRRPKQSLRQLAQRQSILRSHQMTTDDEYHLKTFKNRVKYSWKVLLPKYMLPLTTVYFFEYFINQGLTELITFDNTFISVHSQYRWYNFFYQFGVFISRSSIRWINFNNLYLMSILQAINAVYFLIESIYYKTPSIFIVFVMSFWEGLLGGTAYVNTFNKMTKNILPTRRVFAMGIVNQADSYGISLAGLATIPVHQAICNLPKPKRFKF